MPVLTKPKPLKVTYTPPPTIKEYIKDYRPGKLFYDWVVGPVGSGKTTGIFMKLIHLAKMQEPSPDGIRRTRAVIVRNTAPMLRDTTLVSWGYWFKHGIAGEWKATDKIFVLRMGDIECEVLFRPLDTEDDVNRVLSLEVTFAIIDEFVEIPRKIIEALAARCGRYPSKAMVPGGATNWGMWGSSNPSTEDNWWFDYLHTELVTEEMLGIARYFLQPSGLSPDAENIDNLPGGIQYYHDQMKGKTQAWIKQYIEAEWGFSISGTPVVAGFNASLHVSKEPIQYNPNLPIIVGLDPGLGGSAFIFGQQETWGRLNVLGELIQSGYGAERLIKERLKPYIKRRWPHLDLDTMFEIEADPASNSRSQTDEKTSVDKFKRFFKVNAESNNRLPLRIDAINYFTSSLFEGQPGLLIDAKECPVLIRALKGGWRFSIKSKNDEQDAKPEKNPYSHPGDAFGYLARHFHRATQRERRYSGSAASSGHRRFVIPKRFSPAYHNR